MRKNFNFNESATYQRVGKIVSILAAFVGLGIAAYVTRHLGIHQGSPATIIYLLVGLPSYGLMIMGYRITYQWLQTDKRVARHLMPLYRKMVGKTRR